MIYIQYQLAPSSPHVFYRRMQLHMATKQPKCPPTTTEYSSVFERIKYEPEPMADRLKMKHRKRPKYKNNISQKVCEVGGASHHSS